MYHDILISYREEGCMIYVYDQTGERVLGVMEIDVISYEIIFGLHEIIVSRCRISHDVLNRLLSYAGEDPVTIEEILAH